MSISEALIPEFDMEMATTRRLLERLPEDKFTWKPHEKSMSFGDLAAHVVEMIGWTADTVGSTEFVMPADYKPFRPTTTAELISVFDQNVAAARASIAGASDSQFAGMWALKSAAGDTLLAMPKMAAIRGLIFNHIIHHRGQLSVYARMQDVKIPSIYGPSADENPMAAGAGA